MPVGALLSAKLARTYNSSIIPYLGYVLIYVKTGLQMQNSTLLFEQMKEKYAGASSLHIIWFVSQSNHRQNFSETESSFPEIAAEKKTWRTLNYL